MIQFSANLGFLWAELSLPEAIRAAKKAGFDAVECHWPYTVPSAQVNAALQETGLRMLGLNTSRGDVSQGENGVAALPGQESRARQYIDQAVDYAVAVDCQNIHVMAGFADPDDRQAQDTFAANLDYACGKAARQQKTILIEPLNHRDAPGYHLATLDAVLDILDKVAEPNLKIMFDCYHLQIMGGDLLHRFRSVADRIGHIQFAAVPDRGEPDRGEVNYPWLLSEIAAAGYQAPFGAEYKPRTDTDTGIAWLGEFRERQDLRERQ